MQAVLDLAICVDETVNFEFPVNNCQEGEEGGSIGNMRMGWQGNKFVKNNYGKGDAIYQMISTDSKMCQVGDSFDWWLASFAVLAFLSTKDVVNSNRLFFLHPTFFHLMRYRWCCECPSH